MDHDEAVKSNFVTTWLRDISSWPNELRDKMHFVTSVCVKRYVDRHEHMSRSYTSKSRSYRLSRTCAGHSQDLILTLYPNRFRDVSDWKSMLVSSFECYCSMVMFKPWTSRIEGVVNRNGQNRHQHLKIVINTCDISFWTSVNNINFSIELTWSWFKRLVLGV